MSTPRPSLRDSLADYLNLRRALGFQLANAGRLLEQFVDYLEQRGIDTVTTEHAVAWATLPADASRHWLAIRLSVVRGFTVYLHSIDSSAEVVPRSDPPRGVSGHAVPVLRVRDRFADPGGGRAAAPAAGSHLPELDQPAGDQRDPDRRGDRT